MSEYRERFEALSASLPHLTDEELESTFLNGLDPGVRAEVVCYEPKGLGQIMRAAQKVEDKNLVMAHRLNGNRAIKPYIPTLPNISTSGPA